MQKVDKKPVVRLLEGDYANQVFYMRILLFEMRAVNSKCPLRGVKDDYACNYHYVMFSTARALLTDRQIELVRSAMPIRWRGEGAQPRGGREIRLRRFVARDSARTSQQGRIRLRENRSIRSKNPHRGPRKRRRRQPFFQRSPRRARQRVVGRASASFLSSLSGHESAGGARTQLSLESKIASKYSLPVARSHIV